MVILEREARSGPVEIDDPQANSLPAGRDEAGHALHDPRSRTNGFANPLIRPPFMLAEATASRLQCNPPDAPHSSPTAIPPRAHDALPAPVC